MFEDLGAWLTSIQNQLWFCFSTSVGDLQLLKEKLNSVADHISNIHSFSHNSKFKQCGHEELNPDQVVGKAWLPAESLVRSF